MVNKILKHVTLALSFFVHIWKENARTEHVLKNVLCLLGRKEQQGGV